MNNPFEYRPSDACASAYNLLTERLELLKNSSRIEDVSFLKEIEEGKMLGVLIAEDSEGARHTLYAFSGQLGCAGFSYEGFVEGVFDYLHPQGYFKTKEREISNQNKEIAHFKATEYAASLSEYADAKNKADAEIALYKEKCKISKQKRDADRNRNDVTSEELAVLIRESQYQKAELQRLKKRKVDELAHLAHKMTAAENHLAELKDKRKRDSEALQKWLFDNFKLSNARGEEKSLTDIFKDTTFGIPPSGAGECCAPKLLQAAYKRGWTPLSMAEYWYGKSRDGEVRIHGESYPACRGKCLPILTWMLEGVDVEPSLSFFAEESDVHDPVVIFENEKFCVVNKPGGMLSVPGKGRIKSVEEWLRERYGVEREVKVAHRLDQDTSGLLIATFGADAYKEMQRMFATREVKKCYEAILEGDYRKRGISRTGRISLPLSADWLDRPRQRVDYEKGKEAVTEYEFIEVADGRSRVLFYPHTGRTHQLRVHSSSECGLGMPIVGDRLYGKRRDVNNPATVSTTSSMPAGKTGCRMMLHAKKIEFTWPEDGEKYCFHLSFASET